MSFKDVFKNLQWDEIGIHINGEYLNNLKIADNSPVESRNFSQDDRRTQQSIELVLKMNMKTIVMLSN